MYELEFIVLLCFVVVKVQASAELTGSVAAFKTEEGSAEAVQTSHCASEVAPVGAHDCVDCSAERTAELTSDVSEGRGADESTPVIR